MNLFHDLRQVIAADPELMSGTPVLQALTNSERGTVTRLV